MQTHVGWSRYLGPRLRLERLDALEYQALHARHRVLDLAQRDKVDVRLLPHVSQTIFFRNSQSAARWASRRACQARGSCVKQHTEARRVVRPRIGRGGRGPAKAGTAPHLDRAVAPQRGRVREAVRVKMSAAMRAMRRTEPAEVAGRWGCVWGGGLGGRLGGAQAESAWKSLHAIHRFHTYRVLPMSPSPVMPNAGRTARPAPDPMRRDGDDMAACRPGGAAHHVRGKDSNTSISWTSWTSFNAR